MVMKSYNPMPALPRRIPLIRHRDGMSEFGRWLPVCIFVLFLAIAVRIYGSPPTSAYIVIVKNLLGPKHTAQSLALDSLKVWIVTLPGVHYKNSFCFCDLVVDIHRRSPSAVPPNWCWSLSIIGDFSSGNWWFCKSLLLGSKILLDWDGESSPRKRT